MMSPAASPPLARLSAFARRDPATALGAALVALLVFVAVLAPLLDAHGALEKNLPGGTTSLGAALPPSLRYPFGTDMLGRCEAARVLLGARLSLLVAFPATILAVTIGVFVGTLAGTFGGAVDSLLARLVDAVLAFPYLLLIVALAAVFRESGAGAPPVLLVLGLSGWTTTARVIRAKVLALQKLDFMVAARALGQSRTRILFLHVLPNLRGQIAVLATLVAADMLLAESALSFLGLGVAPPAPSWGRMLSEGQASLQGAPWLVIAPGAAVLVAVLAFNLVGEGLRRTFEPAEGPLSIRGRRTT
jgi:peptide/nickel transport system permease protein